MKKIIEDFTPLGGSHCITNSLKQIFSFNGYPLSEAMLFGLGEGLDFTYLNLQAAPMISGRSKIGEFEQRIADNLSIKIRVKRPKDYHKAYALAQQSLTVDQPVLVYVDMPYMTYFGLPESSHFGGHSIIIFGYDDEEQVFYVSDRDNHDWPIHTPLGTISEDYHLVAYSEMMAARSSNQRPFPANNKYLEFDFTGYSGITKANLRSAIQAVCEKMLKPPAKLKGVCGIEKFAGEILKWKKFTPDKLKQAGATNYFQISGDGGTGGGIFRKMYGEFLNEASEILENDAMKQIGIHFRELAISWDELADDLWKLRESGDLQCLEKMSGKIFEMCTKEKQLLHALHEVVCEEAR